MSDKVVTFKKPQRSSHFAAQAVVAGGLAFAGTLSVAASGISWDDVHQFFPSPNCMIKGNISVSGEHIYHLPGQRYYDDTTIRPLAGERWFCSEAEARNAGCRRSKV